MPQVDNDMRLHIPINHETDRLEEIKSSNTPSRMKEPVKPSSKRTVTLKKPSLNRVRDYHIGHRGEKIPKSKERREFE